jgi:hypothetical protein
MWSLALPDAAIEAGELCLRATAGHDLSTGSLVRVTRKSSQRIAYKGKL